MAFTNDPEVRRKSDLRIFIRNGSIVVEDDEGNRGGNVLSRGGRKISWRNDTGAECRLVFRQLLGEEQDGQGAGTWPFVPDQVPWSNERTLPAQPTAGANPWVGKLANATDLACVKCDVIVELEGVAPLDPIIIVRP